MYKKFKILSLIIIILFTLTGCNDESSITVFNKLEDIPNVQEAVKGLEEKKPVVLTALATWCPHCQRYKPILEEVQEDYKDKITFTTLDVDNKAVEKVLNRFSAQKVPTSAFIRGDGSVYKVITGSLTKEELLVYIDYLLKNKSRDKDEPIAPFSID